MFSKSVLLPKIILFIFLSVPGFADGPYRLPPDSPIAKKEHPRLFFTQRSFAEIAAYINEYESTDFQTYIREVDTVYAVSPAEKERNYLLLDAQNYAFLSYAAGSGLFPGHRFKFSAAEYGRKAIAHGSAIAARIATDPKFRETTHCDNLESSGQGGYINLALASVYDWCYPMLSTAERREMADALITLYQRREKEVDPGKKIKIGQTLLVHCHHAGPGGIVLWGDPLGDSYRQITQEMLDKSLAVWMDCIFAMGEHAMEGAGGWSEGGNYFSGGSLHIYMMAAALSSALGENLYENYTWVRDIPRYLYFYLLPMPVENEGKRALYAQRNDTVDLKVWKSGVLSQITPVIHGIKKAMPELAGFYRWFIEDSPRRPPTADFYEQMPPRVYWMYFKFLWGYRDVQKVTAEQFRLPLSERFGLGDVILLSDLYSEDATKINFYTAQYSLPRHSDEDHGAFVIFKHGTLALDGGIPKSRSGLPKSDKSRTAIYHSKVALYPAENTVAGSSYYSYKGRTCDACDDPWHPANQPGGTNNIGKLNAIHFEPGKFDFIDYDYTRAYTGDGYVEKMRRVLLYFRDPAAPQYQNDEFVVVFDDIRLSDPSVKRRWLLQLPVRPELADGKWTKAGTAFWTADATTLSVTNNLLNAHGKMFVKLLAPDDIQLRLRGGSENGEYFWFTDAEGNSLSKRGPYNDWGAFWGGSHRLEAEHQTDSTVTHFLAVLQIGDSRTLSQIAAIDKIESSGFTGAFINHNRVAMFNLADAPAQTLAYAITSQKKVLHVIEGMQPRTYQISRNNKRLADFTISDARPLFFESPGGGSFLIQPR